jgi:hypothetical protein
MLYTSRQLRIQEQRNEEKLTRIKGNLSFAFVLMCAVVMSMV